MQDQTETAGARAGAVLGRQLEPGAAWAPNAQKQQPSNNSLLDIIRNNLIDDITLLENTAVRLDNLANRLGLLQLPQGADAKSGPNSPAPEGSIPLLQGTEARLHTITQALEHLTTRLESL